MHAGSDDERQSGPWRPFNESTQAWRPTRKVLVYEILLPVEEKSPPVGGGTPPSLFPAWR
jgi:hypothetical protein